MALAQAAGVNCLISVILAAGKRGIGERENPPPRYDKSRRAAIPSDGQQSIRLGTSVVRSRCAARWAARTPPQIVRGGWRQEVLYGFVLTP